MTKKVEQTRIPSIHPKIPFGRTESALKRPFRKIPFIMSEETWMPSTTMRYLPKIILKAKASENASE
jgi:hypothetical protein